MRKLERFLILSTKQKVELILLGYTFDKGCSLQIFPREIIDIILNVETIKQLRKLKEVHGNQNWDWLSSNPNITWEIVKANPDKPWDWVGLSPNVTWENVKEWMEFSRVLT